MNNNKINNRSPKDVDIFAGEQLKHRRQELNMSQKSVAEAVGITFQQIQKYEKGLNRIGASRLYEFCQILSVTPSYFFQQTHLDFSNSKDLSRTKFADSEGMNTADDMVEVIRLYNNIRDVEKRRLVLNLLRSFQ